MNLDDPGFNKVLKTIEKISDFQQFGYRKTYLNRRISIRMRATGSKNYAEYDNYLKRNHDEIKVLLDKLTVNVTSFFRNIDVFEEIEKLVKQEFYSRDDKINVWSAGSSEGREAYSLAMIFKKVLGEKAKNVRIIGTDIDDLKINTGRKGIFLINSHDGLKKEIPKWAYKYINKQENNIIISDDIKQMVRFKHHDLIKEKPLKRMDMVTCRNLLIYIEKNCQVKAISNIHESLKEGGFLILGKTESIPLEIKNLFKPIDLRNRIFVKA